MRSSGPAENPYAYDEWQDMWLEITDHPAPRHHHAYHAAKKLLELVESTGQTLTTNRPEQSLIKQLTNTVNNYYQKSVTVEEVT